MKAKRKTFYIKIQPLFSLTCVDYVINATSLLEALEQIKNSLSPPFFCLFHAHDSDGVNYFST